MENPYWRSLQNLLQNHKWENKWWIRREPLKHAKQVYVHQYPIKRNAQSIVHASWWFQWRRKKNKKIEVLNTSYTYGKPKKKILGGKDMLHLSGDKAVCVMFNLCSALKLVKVHKYMNKQPKTTWFWLTQWQQPKMTVFFNEIMKWQKSLPIAN